VTPGRSAAIRRVLVFELALNLMVAGLKAMYGLWSGSLAIAADAVHSLIDASSNLVGFLVVGRAAEPPDEGHPYGHRKFEIVAAAGIGIAIGVAGIRFAWGAIDALIEARPAPATSWIGFAVIGGTLAVNIFVAAYEARRARQLDSQYLAADAAHTASDVLVTLAVLGSFIAARAGVAWADPVGALVVLVFIGYTAWHVLSRNISVLVDRAAVDADEIRRITCATDGVVDAHRIRSRGNAHTLHIDLHIQMDADMSLRDAHAVAHCVEDT
jgi:cation diffusion facilitator family transporter